MNVTIAKVLAEYHSTEPWAELSADTQRCYREEADDLVGLLRAATAAAIADEIEKYHVAVTEPDDPEPYCHNCALTYPCPTVQVARRFARDGE